MVGLDGVKGFLCFDGGGCGCYGGSYDGGVLLVKDVEWFYIVKDMN